MGIFKRFEGIIIEVELGMIKAELAESDTAQGGNED